jgi:hypothetical protein
MEFSPALLPRGYRTGSPPSHPAGRNGRSSIRKRLHPNDECAGGQHLAPECGCEELAPARLRATVDDGPAQPRARRANLATATVSDSEEEDSDSRGSRISTSSILLKLHHRRLKRALRQLLERQRPQLRGQNFNPPRAGVACLAQAWQTISRREAVTRRRYPTRL